MMEEGYGKTINRGDGSTDHFERIDSLDFYGRFHKERKTHT